MGESTFRLEDEGDNDLTNAAIELASGADSGDVAGAVIVRVSSTGDVTASVSVEDRDVDRVIAVMELELDKLRSRRSGPPSFAAAPPRKASREPVLAHCPHYS